jgi:glycosyltransferase involved in cell wall biosynthesis
MARWATPLVTIRFLSRFRLARRLGYGIVWTAHNILPHRAAPRPLHAAIRRLMMGHAGVVIVHCPAGRDELLAHFPRVGPVEVIPHGNYVGAYPAELSRAQARDRLGLGRAGFVYLALGNIADYKGLDDFIAAFGRAAGPDDVALIAGRNRDAGLVTRLRAAAAHDNRIRLRVGFIPEKDMQLYLMAADVMVAPFKEILTSGSVIAALSFGLPVIVPRLGCLPELVGDEAGLLYTPGDADTLAAALVDVKRRDLAAMSAAARHVAAGLDWGPIGERTAAVYQACLAQ